MEPLNLAGKAEERPGAFSFLRDLPQEWRERRALALVEDLGRHMGRDPKAALERLDTLARTLADDPTARAGWSMSVCAWIERWVQADPISARRLVDDLADHSARYPSEGALKVHWAVGAFHFVQARAKSDPEGSRALLASFEPHLLTPGTPLAVRRLWAMAAQRWITIVALSDTRTGLAGLGAVTALALAVAHEVPVDLSVVSLWLETVTSLLVPELTGYEILQGAIPPQARALEMAYRRHGTIAAALAGLQQILK